MHKVSFLRYKNDCKPIKLDKHANNFTHLTKEAVTIRKIINYKARPIHIFKSGSSRKSSGKPTQQVNKSSLIGRLTLSKLPISIMFTIRSHQVGGGKDWRQIKIILLAITQIHIKCDLV